MKNYELLDIIGGVNEDYVLAADGDAARPRFHWKALAACAACAVLALGIYPIYRAFNPPRHNYTVMKADSALAAGAGSGADKAEAAPEDGAVSADAADTVQPPCISAPAQAPKATFFSGEIGDSGPAEDALEGGSIQSRFESSDLPVDEGPAGQYDRLLQGMGMDGETGAGSYPGWFGGAWIDHGGDAARLTVAIVADFRTPELEAEILGWTGDGVVFQNAKYSHAYLDGLMPRTAELLDGTGLLCSVGVDAAANCLNVDVYSGGSVPDRVLAGLARLDPEGDAIQVRVFPQSTGVLPEQAKGEPAPSAQTAGPGTEGLSEAGENGGPAHNDLLPLE